MDADRFDCLVKTGTGLGSRRSALGVLGAVMAGMASAETHERASAHHHHHPPPKPDPDLCRNPLDPAGCLATGGCNGCVTAAGNLCKTNPCVVTVITFACMPTKEGTNVCARQPKNTTCADFPRCRNSKACGKWHVCGKSCCNGGEFRCFPRCSNTTAPRMAAAIRSGDGQTPLPIR